jgi:hypothetical protein
MTEPPEKPQLSPVPMPPGEAPPAPPKPSSFTERYRVAPPGTPDRPPSPAPPARANANLMLVLVGLVVLAVVLVGGGTWWALGRVGSTSATGTPRPATSADLDAIRGEQSIDAFQAWVANTAGMAFHLDLDETISAQALGATLTAHVDVAGPDWAGTIRIADGKTVKAGDAVYLTGVGYARLPGGKWARSTNLIPYQAPNIFTYIPRSVKIYDQGSETRDGTTVRRLRIGDWIFGDPDKFLNFPAGTAHVTETKFDIWVTTAGVPVAARLDATVVDIETGVEVPVTVHAVYTLTKVGDQPQIKAPV